MSPPEDATRERDRGLDCPARDDADAGAGGEASNPRGSLGGLSRQCR